NKLRLLKLPEEVQTAVLDKLITERHARALIKINDPKKQDEMLEKIMKKDLNVKQTEEAIEKMGQMDEKPVKKRTKRKGVNKYVQIVINTIRQSLNMISYTCINVKTDEEHLDYFYQITIKIPKK